MEQNTRHKANPAADGGANALGGAKGPGAGQPGGADSSVSVAVAAAGERAAAVPGYLTALRALADAHTLGSWVARYLAEEVAGVLADNTLAAKTRDLVGFISWYVAVNGHGELSGWLPRDTQSYLNMLERQGRAPATVNRVFASLRRFAHWCQDQPGGVFLQTGLPTRGIKELSVEEPPCKKLSDSDAHQVFKAAERMVLLSRDEEGKSRRKNARPRRNRAILAVLFYTGLRASELVRLQRRQYDGACLLNVARKGKTRTPRLYIVAKGREALDDYLQAEWQEDARTALRGGISPAASEGDAPEAALSAALERLSRDSGEAENRAQLAALPLFLGTHGKGLDRRHLNEICNQQAKEASARRDTPLQLHPHRLRHSFGAKHRAKAHSDSETAVALGHSGTKYVGRYVRHTEEERREMLEGVFDE